MLVGTMIVIQVLHWK